MSNATTFQPGTRIKTLRGEIDTDEHGQERITPPGSVGVLIHDDVPQHWSVHFGDASVYIELQELRDPIQYEILDSGSAAPLVSNLSTRSQT